MQERNWAALNPFAIATREMNAAHRHEVLEDHISDMNRKKLLDMRMFSQHSNMCYLLMYSLLAYTLATNLGVALEDRYEHQQEFEELNAATPPEVLEGWKAMSTEPKKENGQVYSVYKLNLKGRTYTTRLILI